MLRSNPFSCSPTWSSSCKSWEIFFLLQIIITKLSNLVKLLQILKAIFVKFEDMFKQILKRPLFNFTTEVFKNIPPSPNSEIFVVKLFKTQRYYFYNPEIIFQQMLKLFLQISFFFILWRGWPYEIFSNSCSYWNSEKRIRRYIFYKSEIWSWNIFYKSSTTEILSAMIKII